MSSSYGKPSNRTNDMFAKTTSSINECLSQFNDFTFAINEVCNQASMFGRSLQVLEDMTVPEIIGEQQKIMHPKKFKNSSHLTDSLDTFTKCDSGKSFVLTIISQDFSFNFRIMMSFSDKIKLEATVTFENFIVQAIVPSNSEIKGINEHNRLVASWNFEIHVKFKFYLLIAK